MGFFAVRYLNRVPEEDKGRAAFLGLVRRIPAYRKRRPQFRLSRPFGYAHAPKGVKPVSIIVPVAEADSGTDLASVPAWLGWIASKTGPNLPAALLHDVLVVKTDRDGRLTNGPNGRPLTPVNHWFKGEGDPAFEKAKAPYEPISRWRTDWMFRDAMGDAGVDRIRRWIMWAAVASVTLWDQRPRGFKGWVVAIRALLLLVLFLFAGLFLLPLIVLDILDVGWQWQLLYAGEGSRWAEIGDALLTLGALVAAASILYGLGSRDKDRWLLGGLVLPIFLFGWAAVISVVFVSGFGLIRLPWKQYGEERYAGRVFNYYRRIGVAAIEVEGTELRIGDTVLFSGHTTSFQQTIRSMQIDHTPVEVALPGTEVGIEVANPARKKDKVFLLLSS